MTKGYEPKEKFLGPALTHMREVAFGAAASLHIFKTCDRMEKARNDDAMISAAEAKRQRKNAKRLQSER